MDPLFESRAFTAELQAISACSRTVSGSGSGSVLLLVGNDGGLQHSRRLLLEREGFAVVCLNSRQALAGEGPEVCRLALICRSVGHHEAQRVAQLLHAKQAGLPILRFATTGEAASAEYVALRRESAAPPVLLAEVGRLLLVEGGAAKL